MPGLVGEIDVALSIDFAEFGSLSVVPGCRRRIVSAWAGLPQAGRGAHAQRLMRTQLVVLVAEVIQPVLLEPALSAGAAACLFQRSVEALDLALRLRMADAGEAAAHALLHHPH